VKSPAITVLMPVYNGEKYLHESIASILTQTFTDFEFLIINDGSIDKSEEIILSYSDPRIIYVKNVENIKLISTLNNGIAISKGKYIARMDADDISLPDRLQEQFIFMETHSEVALCGSWFEEFKDGERTKKIVKYASLHNEIMMKMLYQCHFCHPTIIVRKSMIVTFNTKFDSDFIHAEDYDFFVRVGETFKLANIQKVLLRYRFHEKSVSVQYRDTQIKNSTVIKKRLFKKIGFNIDDKELELYTAIAQHDYKLEKEFINKAQALLEKMVLANRISNYFNIDFFQKYIAKFWFNITFNSTVLGFFSYRKFYRSSLSVYVPLSLIIKIKFYTKAFLKK